MQTPDVERRQYARHPLRVPLAVRPSNGNAPYLSRVCDLSEGGVSFTSPTPLAPGATVEVVLPVAHHRFTMAGTVRSCVAGDGGFRIGLAFVEPQMSFRMKLAEQALRIAEFQRDLERERGAPVSLQEATQVWVERYAETFADLLGA